MENGLTFIREDRKIVRRKKENEKNILSKINQTDKPKRYSITWKSVESVEKYSINRYKNLDQRWVSWREKRIVNRILNHLRSANQTLLDIPTGYGRFTELFLKNDFSVTNGDLNLYALEYQQKLHRGSTRVVVSDVNATPFRKNEFDVVFNFRLLQHFKTSAERLSTLSELYRVTKRWVVISVYLESSLHRLNQKLSSRPRKMTMATTKDWENEVSESGMKIVDSWWVLRFFHANKIFLLEKQV
ncbi:MAG: hypothetical protein COT43_01165 [Candidatus Marinimicrobia bacterium CG08_land_8_20_14_0_20_45_22]|nr:MAG: hypothetical protein COT43_01165 [Candidatus Marinimicrobia bacterium CG08_land_8_20_14_0_20_45_22]